MARVRIPPTIDDDAIDRVRETSVVTPERGSELALDALRLAPGASLALHDELHDALLFARSGAGSLDGSALAAPAAGFVAAGERARLEAGSGGLECLRVTVGAATDLHAPLGALQTVVALEDAGSEAATGARSFQLLHGPHNGSTRATAFVGYIPPGKAPWHYHLYDEIVVVLGGTGRLHLEGDADPEPLAPGAAFRLHPREVHVVENAHASDPLVVLGIFTPAGSPSAAYLTAESAASYAFAG